MHRASDVQLVELVKDVKERSMHRSYAVTVTMAVAGLLALPACEVTDPDGEGANIVQPGGTRTAEGNAPGEEETTEQADALGTRSNPLPVGQTARVGDWEITVTGSNTDAADEVEAENEFNEPPAEGRQFVLVGLRATYVGDDSGSFIGDLIYQYVGAGGNTFGGGATEDYCGVIPNDIEQTGETFPGATVEGNLCFSVPVDQIEGGSMIIEGFTFEDTERTFFRIQ